MEIDKSYSSNENLTASLSLRSSPSKFCCRRRLKFGSIGSYISLLVSCRPRHKAMIVPWSNKLWPKLHRVTFKCFQALKISPYLVPVSSQKESLHCSPHHACVFVSLLHCKLVTNLDIMVNHRFHSILLNRYILYAGCSEFPALLECCKAPGFLQLFFSGFTFCLLALRVSKPGSGFGQHLKFCDNCNDVRTVLLCFQWNRC